jgi:hypothetical protein
MQQAQAAARDVEHVISARSEQPGPDLALHQRVGADLAPVRS